MKNKALKGLAIFTLVLALSNCSGNGESDVSIIKDLEVNIEGAYALLISERPQSINSRRVKSNQNFNETRDMHNEGQSIVKNSFTNLFSVDQSGGLHAVLSSNLPTLVSFTVKSPNKDAVYIALRSTWMGYVDPIYDEEGSWVDFDQIIAENNCAIFRLDLLDGLLNCVAQGLYIEGMDENYYQKVSNEKKPIQFDSEGNVYFSASTFEVADSYIQNWDYQRRIYRLDNSTGELSVETQDNESVEFFNVLSTGELVASIYNEIDFVSTLKMFRDGSVIDLSANGSWLKFFTVDDHNTVIFNDDNWSSGQAIRFAKPRIHSFGVEMASIQKQAFESLSDIDDFELSESPEKVLVSDNGRMYGVFTGYSYASDFSENYLVVAQILPYLSRPLLVINMGSQNLWSWLDRTQIQVKGDTLFYVEPIDVPYLGVSQTINMLDVNTLEKTVLLEPSDVNYLGRYDIYNWKLDDDFLYFSALKKDNNSVVMGSINIALYESGSAAEEYLSIKEVSSAAEAMNQIVDMEILQSVDSEENTYTAPKIVLKSQVETNYSFGLDFSAAMEKDSIESYLTLVSSDLSEGNSGTIDYLTVWIKNSMHIIPDIEGLADSSSTIPLTYGTDYQVTLPADIDDVFGNKTSYFSEAITLRPAAGWFISNRMQLNHIVDEDIPNNSTIHNLFGAGTDLAEVSIPDHFELTIDVVDADHRDLTFLLNDWGSVDKDEFLSLDFDNYYNYVRVWSNDSYIYRSHSIDGLSGKTIRIRLFGANLQIDSKEIGSADSDYINHRTIGNVNERVGSDYRLSIQNSGNIVLDNVLFKELDSDGSLVNDGVTAHLDFDDGLLAETFENDISDQF
jgi:hypothetical protein